MVKTKKTKIMLHIIMPNQVSGPNNANKLISNSYLNEKYEFEFLIQKFHAAGKINLKLIKDLSNQIKKFNPDIIHLSGLQSSAFHAVIAARLCKKKKILLAIRGSSKDAINISKKMKFVFGKIIEPLTMKLSKKIYTVCQAMGEREYIKKNAKERLIGTLHNSAPKIDLAKIENFNLRNKLKISEDSIIVVIVGRIVYDKGVTFISGAIKNVSDNRIKFVFIGDGSEQKDLIDDLLTEIQEKKVFFIGKQDNVISILKECNIFLFATLHENLSNALLEACSLGLAVIATNVGGNPEVIKNKFNGLLIPPASSLSIQEKVLELANNKSLRIELGENAKKYINENFSQELLLRNLEKIYEDLSQIS
jgi:glycosyltransferase involved in cell wall biosynthesis